MNHQILFFYSAVESALRTVAYFKDGMRITGKFMVCFPAGFSFTAKGHEEWGVPSQVAYEMAMG